MDAALKELAKLEKLTADGKAKSPPIDHTLDMLLATLRAERERIQSGSASSETFEGLATKIEGLKKDLDERQKEIYNSVSRYGKALDKKFPNSLPTFSPLFTSDKAFQALDRTVALHFLRTGQFTTAETFIEEAGVNVSEETRTLFLDLHRIVTALKAGDIDPALEWVKWNRDFLHARQSPLEFQLHRARYLHFLIECQPPDVPSAVAYAKANFGCFYSQNESEIMRLMACIVYLPLARLRASPYADLASPNLYTDIDPMFAREYCASLGMSRQIPLKVVGDIGGGGALARIEKGRKLMRERKSEWSQTDELPIEIPLPAENRYHSIFACPVSKEQSTEQNPPMMMECGHVVIKDSLQKLSKSGGRVKCPYCPVESQAGNALLVRF
ncbi:hypothetical protein BDM02DRAFT_3135933 [Thelephora ganbajun]|uniref:Uncharacterized protein n=1 Tax=Thelephora ganbajun TaxID=370292 RepID=A0ACB6ZUN8_THEGA|nr:hypothetical protein BDM02DRAFT_3135933 [Thelephora ganbajun]